MMQHPYHHNNNNEDESTLGSREGTIDYDYGDDGQSLTNNNMTMQPSSPQLPRIVNAGLQLQSLLRSEMSGNPSLPGFPPLCLPITRLLAGNHCCVDCGDENDHLVYASLGYGTTLCQECATRHATVTPHESNIRHLNDHDWDLRMVLTLLEGGNTNMLDYVKNKPRWRPSKFGKSEDDSDDVLAFKQIYLSKAATTYRTNLIKKVDERHYEFITTMREEDEANEEQLIHSSSLPDPFARIFERNNMTGDELPGFQSRNAGGFSDNTIAGVSMSATVGGRSRGGRNVHDRRSLMNKAPSAKDIQQRIASRRNLNHNIAAREQQQREGGDGGAIRGNEHHAPAVVSTTSYQPRKAGRRASDQMVAEVGQSFLALKESIKPTMKFEDEGQLAAYSSRANQVRMPPVRYRHDSEINEEQERRMSENSGGSRGSGSNGSRRLDNSGRSGGSRGSRRLDNSGRSSGERQGGSLVVKDNRRMSSQSGGSGSQVVRSGTRPSDRAPLTS